MPKATAGLPKPLKKSEVYKTCAPADLPKFQTTSDFKPSNEIYSQERAIQAIEMGLGITRPGYNIYVSGVPGTGRTSVMRSYLRKWANKQPAPQDWIYVYNFDDKDKPKILSMPTGTARKFAKTMDQLVVNLRSEISATLQGEDFEKAVNSRMGSANERKNTLLNELEKVGRSLHFEIKMSNQGIETIPIVDGEQLDDSAYSKLSPEQREQIENGRKELEPAIHDFARSLRAIEVDTREYVQTQRDETAREVIQELIKPIRDSYKDLEQILEHLTAIEEAVLENLSHFYQSEDEEQAPRHPRMERDPLIKYKVNVFVDNKQQKNAPLVFENKPTFYNLFGKVEKSVEHGIYSTDFSMIKAGAVHKANGGYLVLDASDLLTNPAIWDTLKRVIRHSEGFIEDMGEQYSMLPTSGLKPESMPLKIKLIVIGNDYIYHSLYDIDEDFPKIFKIKADFDHKMPRTKKNIRSYTKFIAKRCEQESLRPFDKAAVSTFVEFGSRMMDNQSMLSTQFGQLKDLSIESDYIAGLHGSKVVKRDHVEEALEKKFYRHNLYEAQLLEMIKDDNILLSVSGKTVGQVNGLTVLDLGDYSFGKPCRVTAVSNFSDDGILNIERAVRLSGKIHDKGMYILTGFLNSLLCKKHKIGFSASVCFEQSYGMIDGDSASITELTAILSSLAEIPVMQNLAMTGSVNQFGEVQPVGGVNEKIEGFFKVTKLLGKKGPFTVMLPHQNAIDLMLHRDVQEAVQKGKFNIIPVKYFWQVFEIATGVPLGIKSLREKKYSAGSALEQIEKKMHASELVAVKREKKLQDAIKSK